MFFICIFDYYFLSLLWFDEQPRIFLIYFCFLFFIFFVCLFFDEQPQINYSLATI